MNQTAFTALVIAAALLWARQAQAQKRTRSIAGDDYVDTYDLAPIQPQAQDNPDAVVILDDYSPEVTRMIDRAININAFLFMIRACEHRYPRDVVNDACYEIFYGGQTFDDLSDHPVITGELAPVPLPDAMCRAAGLKSPCFSTAAGAYQFIRPTWQRLRNKLNLKDFGPQAQDEAAYELLVETGVVDLIDEGNIEAAIRKAGKTWASLPGNNYQQNPKAMRYALDRFVEGQKRAAETFGVDLLPPLP